MAARSERYRPMAQTQGNAKFDPGPVPPGASIKTIFCARSDVVPAPGDYKVVAAGYPLMLFATFAHEMGHGIAGVLSGEHFERFQLFAFLRERRLTGLHMRFTFPRRRFESDPLSAARLPLSSVADGGT